MKSAYLLTGIQLRMLFRLMRRRRFSFRPKYIGRFLFIFQNAVWASFFALKERIHYGKSIHRQAIPDNPLIIIGHSRTVITFLHQLLNLDENLAAPTLFQTSQPNGFVSAYRYFRPIMQHMLGKHRPFDRLKAGMDEPQEDEFALIRLSGFSPLCEMVFPTDGRYFPVHYPEFLPPDDLKPAWEKSMLEFYRKLAWFNKKQLVLKNPFHSMRIPELRRLFPRARFIHIYRNPYDVVPSTQKMWSIVGSQNCMNRRWKNPECADVAGFMNTMLETINTELEKMPAGDYYEICYEKLEKNPQQVIGDMYRHFGMEFSESFGNSIRSFLDETGVFEKGRYDVGDDEKKQIFDILSKFMKKYRYA